LFITQERVVQQIQLSTGKICNRVATELLSATGENRSDLHSVITITFGEKIQVL